MRKLLAIPGKLLFIVAMLYLSAGAVQAQDPTFSEAELDQMMAPIALYPDSLLAQILMAATYPVDVAEAVKWSAANPDQEGDAAVEAVQDKSWDPSVMSLVAFPQVLTMMGEQPDWVQNVGDAFLADSETVMDTVQKLRNKANDEGNLKSSEQQTITVQEEPSTTETIIIIEPAQPQVIYVPTYNPTYIYGPWWWPRYTPWYYYPPGYGFGTAVWRGIGFGIGIGIGNALWGGCHWGRGRGRVDINVNRYNNINIGNNRINSNNRNSNWKHNANNRKGVPYKDNRSREQFSNKRDGASNRQDYRGRDAQRDQARNTLDKRAVSPSEGRRDLQGAGGDKARSSVNKANRDVAQGKTGFNNKSKASTSNRATSQNRKAGSTRSTGQTRNYSSSSRNNALKNSGNANRSRQSINRGQSSHQRMSRSGSGRRR
ncbi:MAG: DUF3300 domain-containing protein [Xanthomonadales bacterium]|nr:DUF3300 domain-containing protein [Xanthomonadales bacterium]